MRKTACIRLLMTLGILALPLTQSADPGGGQEGAHPAEGGTISIWPADAKTGEARNPTGCEAHLLSAKPEAQELVVGCGEAIVHPSERTTVWLEDQERMSEVPALLERPTVAERDAHRRLTLPLAPAGTVRLRPTFAAGVGRRFRLLHLESHNRGKHPAAELLRPLPAAGRHEVLMPVGPVVALLYDLEKREYVTLSRPAVVEHDTITEVAPRAPERSDLLVVLERPEILVAFDQYDVRLALDGDRPEPRAPDVTVPALERLYAIWFDLPAGPATVNVRSPSVYLPPQEVVLPPGRLAYLAAELRPLPALDVVLALPEVLRTAELVLEVQRLPSTEAVRRVELAQDTAGRLLSAMPAVELMVVLESAPWRFRQRVDLSDGGDGTVFFAPEPILLFGTVYHGDEGHPASIAINADLTSGEFMLESDEEGRYETILFRPGSFIANVRLAGSNGPPLMKLFEVPNQSSFEYDFHIAEMGFRVSVVDAVSGEAIAQAKVTFTIEVADGGNTVQTAETDAQGMVELAHLRPGKLTILAGSEGYVPYEGEPLEVTDGGGEHELTVALESIGEMARMLILLPSGAPAAEAEVLALASLTEQVPAWSGRSDAGGWLEVPRRFEGYFLLARHPLAASGLRRWQASSENETIWALAEPASDPLSIVVRTNWDKPARWAQVALWLDGRRMSGFALSWLTYSRRAGADSYGFWQASHLPRGPVRLLAYAAEQRPQVLAGALDGLATFIPFPWSGEIEINYIE